MLTRKIKDLLDTFKSTEYNVYKIVKGDRIDSVLHRFYGENNLIFLKCFCYLNDIIYPLYELEADDLIKIYDLSIFALILKQNNIDLTEQIYK